MNDEDESEEPRTGQRYGTFEEAETAALGGDGVASHDLAGAEREGDTRPGT